jgi:hypothetical protein
MSGVLISGLVSGLGWLKRIAEALIGFAARHPWQALCAVLALASAMLWRGEHRAQHRYEAAQAAITALHEASNKAAAIALTQRQADEQHYKELAHDADHDYAARAADARAATADFIRLHRLPAAGSRAAGPAPGQARGGGTAVPSDAAAVTSKPALVVAS